MTKVDELIKKFKEFKEELNKDGTNCSYKPAPNATIGTSGGEGGMYRSEEAAKAEAGKNPKVLSTTKILKPSDTAEHGAAGFAVNVPAPAKSATSPRHPMSKQDASPGGAQDTMMMSEVIKADKNGQWQINKVDAQENINIAHPKGPAKKMKPLNEVTHKAEGTNRKIASPDMNTVDQEDARGRVHMVKDEGTNHEANPTKPHNKGKFKVMDEVEEKSSEKASPKGKPYSDKGEIKKGEKKILVGTGTNDENTGPGRSNGFGL